MTSTTERNQMLHCRDQRATRHMGLVLLVTILAIAMWACGSNGSSSSGSQVDTNAAGGPVTCASNADCNADEVCANAKCEDAPDDDGPGDRVNCATDAECGTDEVCSNGNCEDADDDEEDEGDDEDDDGPGDDDSCVSNADCDADEVCTNGECEDA